MKTINVFIPNHAEEKLKQIATYFGVSEESLLQQKVIEEIDRLHTKLVLER